MQPDERELLKVQWFLAGYRACRRDMIDAATEYEAKAALARVLAEANGRDRAQVRVDLDDHFVSVSATCPKCGGKAERDDKDTTCFACGLVVS